jgi:diguanylate cyclase (GGDEF)-like protein
MEHSPFYKVIVISFFLALFSSLYGLDPSKDLHHFVHTNWTREDGLPQNAVQDAIQSRNGYIWMGTQMGIVRFDGRKFTHYEKKNSDAITNNTITAVFEDSRGTIWFGTYGGIVRHRKGEFTLFSKKDGLLSNMVFSVYEDSNRTVWVGTEEGGLHKFKDGVLKETVLVGEKQDKPTVRAVLRHSDGRLWIGTDSGLFYLENGKVFKFQENKIKTAVALLESNDKALWIGSSKTGLYKYKDSKLTHFTNKSGLMSNILWELYQDSNGSIWVGTDRGLNVYRDGKFKRANGGKGIDKDSVRSLFEDYEGNLWVATWTSGLHHFKDGKFITYTKHDGLGSSDLFSIYEDRDENIWVGTYDAGLTIMKDKIERVTVNDGLASNRILTIFKDSKNREWIGTFLGLNMRHNGKIEFFTQEDGIPNSKIRTVIEDSSGNIWIGSDGGPVKFDGEKFEPLYDNTGAQIGKTFVIREDSKGTLWFGTSQGLYSYMKGVLKKYTTGEGLPVNLIFDIYVDSDDSLWISTYGGGITHMNGEKFTVINTQKGLYYDSVFFITEDNNGRFWMSSNDGVFSVKKSEMLGVIAGEKPSVESTAYGVADGMKSSECSGGYQPAGVKRKNGDIWFPTTGGAAVINPADIKINSVKPPVHIEAFVAGERYLPIENGNRISADTKELEFHYTGLSYVAANKIKYRFKLEGFDEKWRDAGVRDRAYYTNLPPGKYQFRVIAANKDGVWNREGDSISFIKEAFFYQTVWFYILMIFAAALVAGGIYNIRVRSINARALQLEKLVKQRTAELRENAKLLEEKSEQLKDAALRDPLTGLRNRRFCSETIIPDTVTLAKRRSYLINNSSGRRTIPEDTVYGLLLLDIDHFKKVNDRYGHDAGDKILKQFSQILTSSIRSDDAVIRWGGEEFLIILKNTNSEYVENIAKKIKNKIELSEFLYKDDSSETLKKTCSIGFTIFPFYSAQPDALTFEQVVMITDLGLYYSKNNGRNLSVGVGPGEVFPDKEELMKMLTSLEYGVDNRFYKLKV